MDYTIREKKKGGKGEEEEEEDEDVDGGIAVGLRDEKTKKGIGESLKEIVVEYRERERERVCVCVHGGVSESVGRKYQFNKVNIAFCYIM